MTNVMHYSYLRGPGDRFRNPYVHGVWRNCSDFLINGYNEDVELLQWASRFGFSILRIMQKSFPPLCLVLGYPAISVDDTWKIIACKDQKKKLMGLEAELAAVREEGFVAKYAPNMNGTYHKRRPFLVVGIAIEISHKKNRDAVRRSWMPTSSIFYCVGFHSLAYKMKLHYFIPRLNSLLVGRHT